MPSNRDDDEDPVVFWGGFLLCVFLVVQFTSCDIMGDMEKRIMALEQDSHAHD